MGFINKSMIASQATRHWVWQWLLGTGILFFAACGQGGRSRGSGAEGKPAGQDSTAAGSGTVGTDGNVAAAGAGTAGAGSGMAGGGGTDGTGGATGVGGAAKMTGSPGRVTIRYAHGFTIEYHDQYKVVHILDRQAGRTDTVEYLLVRRGTPVPAGYEKARIVTIPLRNMVLLSSMHIGLADFAGVSDRITGLGNLQYVNSPVVLNNIKAGKVKQVGIDDNINNELVITMHPDVLMAMGNPDAGSGVYKTLTDAGVPVIVNSEWLENTPLGRAEWVKLMGALVDRDDSVERKFDSVAADYNKLAAMGRAAAVKPKVIIGIAYKGTWYVPAGESYMAEFLRDAGAFYKWAGTKGVGSLALNFEAVAPEALTADYWLNVGYAEIKKNITEMDKRYGEFLPVRADKVYNYNGKVSESGANDYWESGVVNPQIVLADMIAILHPDLLPGRKLIYYKKVG